MLKMANDYYLGKGWKFGAIALALVLAIIVGFCWFWWGWRVQLQGGQFAVLLQKDGKDLTNEMLLAPSPEYKGIQLQNILTEGRYFLCPYFNEWYVMDATVIPENKVGVLVRKFGKPLPPEQIVALQDDQKGIVVEPLLPGRHYINTFAYDVVICDMVQIDPGYVGVVTLLSGKSPKTPNNFVVEPGERGIQSDLLSAGAHQKYSNPFVYKVIPVETRSQKFEVAGLRSISFPSRDGFDITVEGTIEWAPNLKKLAETFAIYVEQDALKKSTGINENLQNKIILPFARSWARMIGSNHNAVDFITGAAKTVVQTEVEAKLKAACQKEGIEIKSFVIRSADPPAAIRTQYERREIARRDKDKLMKEVETEIGPVVVLGGTPKLGPDGKPELDEFGNPVIVGGTPQLDPETSQPLRKGGRLANMIQVRSLDRATKIGEVRRDIVKDIREAETYAVVLITKSKKNLEVAQVNLEAAKDQAAQVVAQGTAAADVDVMKAKADAAGTTAKIAPFGSGEKYAENLLIAKISPAIKNILSNTDGPFAKLFERFASFQPTSATQPAKN